MRSGLLLCAVSIKDFAMPANKEMNDNGVYRFSRNPMYVAYFLIFSGTCFADKILDTIWNCNYFSGFCALGYYC